jgi:DNA-binding MarR family transcriptional regulator
MTAENRAAVPGVPGVLLSLRALSAEMDRLDQVAAERYGLNRTDMRGLEIVSRQGSLAPTELARLLGLTTGGVTTVIDRLERAGYVRRRPDRSDRRRLLVEATPLTAARDIEVFADLVRATAESLAAYSATDLALIHKFLETTREITTAHATAIAGHPPLSQASDQG